MAHQLTEVPGKQLHLNTEWSVVALGSTLQSVRVDRGIATSISVG
ncbi:hypothetical protein [Kamptonema sp. UHCC 0994]|nr:hypothetical protein [Kamptonema sp. UHCC 0994]